MAYSLFGSPEQNQQVSTLNPQQQGVQGNILSQIQALLKPGGGADFGAIEQNARQNFAQKTIPGIAERFTQLGAQGSSGFRQALGQAGAGLESDLASQKAQFGQNQLRSLLGYGFQPSTENRFRPESGGIFGDTLSTAAPLGIEAALKTLFSGGSPASNASGGSGFGDAATAAASTAAGTGIGSYLGSLGSSALTAAQAHPYVAAGTAGTAALAALIYYLSQRQQ